MDVFQLAVCQAASSPGESGIAHRYHRDDRITVDHYPDQEVFALKCEN